MYSIALVVLCSFLESSSSLSIISRSIKSGTKVTYGTGIVLSISSTLSDRCGGAGCSA